MYLQDELFAPNAYQDEGLPLVEEVLVHLNFWYEFKNVTKKIENGRLMILYINIMKPGSRNIVTAGFR
ncbi:hypothetical protein VE23_20795 [Paenibacillus sp. D9]|nr:hypothetical protein VE23_20795 [Paenibacillus sp. D9]